MHSTFIHRAAGPLISIVAIMAGFAVAFDCPARAQDFSVPEGFLTETPAYPGPSGHLRLLTRVRPAEGPFAELSSIELSIVSDPIDKTDEWLRARMSADLGDEGELDAVFDSPDSPFSDPVFNLLRSGFKTIVDELARLGQLPLEFCKDLRNGRNEAGDFRELPCTIDLGPIKQYIVLRLQEVDGVWYYTAVRTMNERRLRHLVAIANSFHVR